MKIRQICLTIVHNLSKRAYLLICFITTDPLLRLLLYYIILFLLLRASGVLNDLFSITEAYASSNTDSNTDIDIYLNNPEEYLVGNSEYGYNNPYSRVEGNVSADGSNNANANAEANEGASSSQSKVNKGKQKVDPLCPPLERFLKQAAEEQRVAFWLENEASPEEREAYQRDLQRHNEEAARAEEARREARRLYNAKRYQERKKQK